MFFRNEYALLSNMYPTPLRINGFYFSCAEAAFQSFKTTDLTIRTKFQFISGKEAKQLGRKIELRPDWNDIRLEIMEAVIRCKVKRYPELLDIMTKADKEPGGIVEDNYWNDTFWGVCNGKGQNHLGKIYTKILKERSLA